MESKPVLLTGYDTKRCARRIHNEWDDSILEEPWEPSPEVQRMFDEGLEFEAAIFEHLAAVLGNRLVHIDPLLRKTDAIAATVEALRSGAEVITGGWLPDDLGGARTGKPDVLVRMDRADGSSFYAPGDIKGHKTVKVVKSGRLAYSLPDSPSSVMVVDGLAEEVAGCFDDFLQLAHYSRMLDAAGFGPDAPNAEARSARMGFIIGRDSLMEWVGSEHVLVWHDLDAPLFKTFSRRFGSAKRSALERYNHEHDFRVKVAQVAQMRKGSPSDPEPLVVPIGQDECLECPWENFCTPLLTGIASGEISSGRLSVREWLSLQSIGVLTTEDLAAVDVDDPQWLQEYLALVPHRSDAEKRLRKAVIRARMIGDGEVLRRTSAGPLSVPSADVEIDFDIEWDGNDRVYLWGARIRNGLDDASGRYVPFVSWDELDEESERDLAQEFLTWLRAQIQEAQDRGETIAVFHYTSPEVRYLQRVLGADNVADVLEHFVDVHAFIREHFIGVNGLGVKKVAAGFGFAWRDEDPGGLQAQTWLNEVKRLDREATEGLRNRILEYNEDDVRATAAVRDGLRNSNLL